LDYQANTIKEQAILEAKHDIIHNANQEVKATALA